MSGGQLSGRRLSWGGGGGGDCPGAIVRGGGRAIVSGAIVRSPLVVSVIVDIVLYHAAVLHCASVPAFR